MNKPSKHDNIIKISSFRYGLNDTSSSSGFYFERKTVEGVMKQKNNMYLNIWTIFLKMYIFEVGIFFSLSAYPTSSIFQ